MNQIASFFLEKQSDLLHLPFKLSERFITRTSLNPKVHRVDHWTPQTYTTETKTIQSPGLFREFRQLGRSIPSSSWIVQETILQMGESFSVYAWDKVTILTGRRIRSSMSMNETSRERVFFFPSGIVVGVPVARFFESVSHLYFTSVGVAMIIAPLVEEFAKAHPLFFSYEKAVPDRIPRRVS